MPDGSGSPNASNRSRSGPTVHPDQRQKLQSKLSSCSKDKKALNFGCIAGCGRYMSLEFRGIPRHACARSWVSCGLWIADEELAGPLSIATNVASMSFFDVPDSMGSVESSTVSKVRDTFDTSCEFRGSIMREGVKD